MTCVVGIADGKTVTIGGDSAGVSGWDLRVRADEKVWVRDGWAFGFTTSFRMGQLLRWSFVPPPSGDDPFEQYMATTFIDAIRQSLKDGGFAKADNGREEGGEFLVGHAGRLFHVWSDYQVQETSNGLDAAGCGGPYAIGAVHASSVKLGVRRRITRALEIAEACSAGVRGPFHVVTT